MKKYKGFEFVNLGLPSGTMWATCNVGAASETDPGLYFQWGEPVGHAKDSGYDYEKSWGRKLESHRKRVHRDLSSIEDGARIAMGGSWQIPNSLQAQELIQNCTVLWSENYKGTSTKGFVLISKRNGNSIFIPASGAFWVHGAEISDDGINAFLWTRKKYGGIQAESFEFRSDIPGHYGLRGDVITYGLSIRGVFRFKQRIPHRKISSKSRINNKYQVIDLGLPSGTLWANMNVGAASETDPGLYFQWGDPVGHAKDSGYNFSKKSYKKKGLWSLCENLDPENDAAHIYMGDSWQMPNENHIHELRRNCVVSFAENYNESGVNGYILTSRINGNSIFFPQGGFIQKKQICAGEKAFFWTRKIEYERTDTIYACLYARESENNSEGNILPFSRGIKCYNGLPVRGIKKSKHQF